MSISAFPVFGIFLPGHIEIVIVGFVVLLLFGHRLPGLMRSMGASVTEFKKGLHDESGEEAAEDDKGEKPA